MYGRACMLYARSLEILDQLGLFDSIAEIGYITK
jgi:phenol 2-monooxygenase